MGVQQDETLLSDFLPAAPLTARRGLSLICLNKARSRTPIFVHEGKGKMTPQRMKPATSVERDRASRPRHADPHVPSRGRFIGTLALVAALWIASDAGYYWLRPSFGIQTNYNASSIAIGAYYALWVALALVVFWPLYRTWWVAHENRFTTYVLLSLAFAALVLFPGYALPLLPPINWAEPWRPPEVVFATPWYFLPKSIEILFQQFLIAAMVIALSAQRYGLWTISLACAAAFGATHILVAFDNVPAGYVIRFMAAGALFGSWFHI
jgi:hypothetical protein